MTTNEAKKLINSAKSTEREVARVKKEIDERREELLGIGSSLRGGDKVMASETISMPERVYFSLEALYVQLSNLLQKLYDIREELEKAISTLDPLEQEIVRAWIAGNTEEQIGKKVGYSRPTISRHKRRILIKLSEVVDRLKVDTP